MLIPERPSMRRYATLAGERSQRSCGAQQTTCFEESVRSSGDDRGTMTSAAGGTLDTDSPPYPFGIGHGELGTLAEVVDEVRVNGGVDSPRRVRGTYRSPVGAT